MTDPVTGAELTEDQYKDVVACRNCIANARTSAASSWSEDKRAVYHKIAENNKAIIEKITGRPEPDFYSEG